MMELSLLDPLAGDAWDSLADAFPGRTAFHSAAWARVLHDAYGFRPRYIAGRSGGAPVCALPLMEVRSAWTGTRGVSLPFTDLCPPLLAAGADPGELLDFVLDLSRRSSWSCLQLRGWPTLEDSIPPAERYLHHLLPLGPHLPDPASGFGESTRRNIAQARKQGVTVRVETGAEAMETFRRLNRLTRRDHGLPPQPPRFFRSLHRHLIARGLGRILLADAGGQTVAGAVFLHAGESAIYKYGASQKSALLLRPNNLVMAEAIRLYRGEGFRRLSFGRTEPSNDGLRRYKVGWGGTEEELRYLRYSPPSGAFVADPPRPGNLANRIFRSLPLSALDLIGRALYRHVA